MRGATRSSSARATSTRRCRVQPTRSTPSRPAEGHRHECAADGVRSARGVRYVDPTGMLGALAPNPSWLTNSTWAMPMIALYVTWKQLGFFILLYLAALQNVPNELYEAAKTDGANWWQSFRAVTWT